MVAAHNGYVTCNHSIMLQLVPESTIILIGWFNVHISLGWVELLRVYTCSSLLSHSTTLWFSGCCFSSTRLILDLPHLFFIFGVLLSALRVNCFSATLMHIMTILSTFETFYRFMFLIKFLLRGKVHISTTITILLRAVAACIWFA